MRSYLTSIIPAALILLFTYAALSKLMVFADFRGQLHNQDIPYWLAETLLYTLPPVELLTAGLLFFPKTCLQGLCLSALLLIVFSVYIALVYFHVFSRVPCSCGGILNSLSWGGHLLLNLAFLSLNLIAIRTERQERRQIQA